MSRGCATRPDGDVLICDVHAQTPAGDGGAKLVEWRKRAGGERDGVA